MHRTTSITGVNWIYLAVRVRSEHGTTYLWLHIIHMAPGILDITCSVVVELVTHHVMGNKHPCVRANLSIMFGYSMTVDIYFITILGILGLKKPPTLLTILEMGLTATIYFNCLYNSGCPLYPQQILPLGHKVADIWRNDNLRHCVPKAGIKGG